MADFGYVYKIVNKRNGKAYIGQTVQNPQKRFNQHVFCANPQYKQFKYSYIHKAIYKHGVDNFYFAVVCRATNQQELDSREQFCIKAYKSLAPSGYNLKSGGYGRSQMHSDTKHKLRLAQLGKKRGAHKPSTIEKIRAANTGRKVPIETRNKLSIAHIGKTDLYNNKRVQIINIQTQEMQVFKSISEASRQLRIGKRSISNCVNGISKIIAKKFTVREVVNE